MKKTVRRYRVALTYPLPRRVIDDVVKPWADVTLVRTRAELIRALPRMDGVLTLLTDRVDEPLLQRAARLRAVGNVAVGYDNIDLNACQRRGIAVLNTPDVLTRATAELTLALLFATARRISEGNALCRSGRWRGWDPGQLIGQQLQGRRAVILGRGRIGRETAKLLRALGIRAEFITRTDRPSAIANKLNRAQILSIHAPLTPKTRHWLNAYRLGLLPPDAIVLNTSRGPLIDEAALAAALARKQIFAAGLDVYEHEPRINPRLRKLPNVVLLPHIGSATAQTREAMARLAAQGVINVLRGKRAKNRVV
ncbi:MAG: 2-hydroxyacid dehydrogenase [Bacteriovoracia bacterium]